MKKGTAADRFFYAVLVVPLATVCGTLVGGRTITEKWVEVHPSRINFEHIADKE